MRSYEIVDPTHPPPDLFPTTHWTRVVRAGDPQSPEARAALADLCTAYWYPIYAFIRRRGHDADAAADLTQAFFARLIERGNITAADPAKGRFRTFLRTDCGFFLADQVDRHRALKRGGGRAPVSLDAADAESRYRLEPAHDETAERLFDRAWALALLDHTMDELARHYASTNRSGFFDALKPTLTGDSDAATHTQLAARLGMTTGAVQVAVHRLRARYAVALRSLVAATLDAPTSADIDEEVRGLFAALSG